MDTEYGVNAFHRGHEQYRNTVMYTNFLTHGTHKNVPLDDVCQTDFNVYKLHQLQKLYFSIASFNRG